MLVSEGGGVGKTPERLSCADGGKLWEVPSSGEETIEEDEGVYEVK
jgi:hypothetical protein